MKPLSKIFILRAWEAVFIFLPNTHRNFQNTCKSKKLKSFFLVLEIGVTINLKTQQPSNFECFTQSLSFYSLFTISKRFHLSLYSADYIRYLYIIEVRLSGIKMYTHNSEYLKQ